MNFDLGKTDERCGRLNRIAQARGGSCVSHTVKARSRVLVYEH